MKKILEELGAVIIFLAPYPTWVKGLFVIWVLGTCALLLAFVLAPRKAGPAQPARPPLTWEKFDVLLKEGGQSIVLRSNWSDIAWIDSEGWLCGAIEAGGGGGDVGRGMLVRSIDGGNSWRQVDKKNFESGKGSFSWGPTGTYTYTWSEVGPINSILVYKRHLGEGRYRTEAWIGTATGVYSSEDAGEKWIRKTPPPDDPLRYALFARILQVEAFNQVYAVGWQGIAHWPASNGGWELQLPTYTSAIVGIDIGPGREIWAVGHAPNPEAKRTYGGAIYRRPSDSAPWTIESLNRVEFEKDEFPNDIRVINHEVVLAVGQRGLIARGRRQKDESFQWERISSGTEQGLRSIDVSDNVIWVVGDSGTVLFSTDKGESWQSAPPVVDEKKQPINLHRVRFFGSSGWILGSGAVLKSTK